MRHATNFSRLAAGPGDADTPIYAGARGVSPRANKTACGCLSDRMRHGTNFFRLAVVTAQLAAVPRAEGMVERIARFIVSVR